MLPVHNGMRNQVITSIGNAVAVYRRYCTLSSTDSCCCHNKEPTISAKIVQTSLSKKCHLYGFLDFISAVAVFFRSMWVYHSEQRTDHTESRNMNSGMRPHTDMGSCCTKSGCNNMRLLTFVLYCFTDENAGAILFPLQLGSTLRKKTWRYWTSTVTAQSAFCCLGLQFTAAKILSWTHQTRDS